MKKSQFQKLTLCICIGSLILSCNSDNKKVDETGQPNILIILADDLGFSDLGCYGSEICTPNIDKLAFEGQRMTQFYTTSRCSPSRSTLLTGLYPQQTGVGHLDIDLGRPAYQGFLNDQCVTLAEVLKENGYSTYHSGKWHVGLKRGTWATDRGFDHSFFILSTGGYFDTNKIKIFNDTSRFISDDPNFYLTDAISDYGVKFINENQHQEQPFFLYLAYTAPHFPLHAFDEDIQKYRNKYKMGWDELREQRFEKMKYLEIINKDVNLSPRNEKVPAWESLSAEEKDAMDLRMAVYAAMIDRLDIGVGKVMEALKETDQDKNTLVIFLSDNGACHEEVNEFPWKKPNVEPVGTEDSFESIGYGWANVSTTPFRNFKHWEHEGGIISPFIAWYPTKIQSGIDRHTVGHLIDLMPTLLNIANIEYPANYNGNEILPMVGENLANAWYGTPLIRDKSLFWEHEGNKAVRQGDWKLVKDFKLENWELYNMAEDPTELENLLETQPELSEELENKYKKWAQDVGADPWEIVKLQLDSLWISWFGCEMDIR